MISDCDSCNVHVYKTNRGHCSRLICQHILTISSKSDLTCRFYLLIPIIIWALENVSRSKFRARFQANIRTSIIDNRNVSGECAAGRIDVVFGQMFRFEDDKLSPAQKCLFLSANSLTPQSRQAQFELMQLRRTLAAFIENHRLTMTFRCLHNIGSIK